MSIISITVITANGYQVLIYTSYTYVYLMLIQKLSYGANTAFILVLQMRMEVRRRGLTPEHPQVGVEWGVENSHKRSETWAMLSSLAESSPAHCTILLMDSVQLDRNAVEGNHSLEINIKSQFLPHESWVMGSSLSEVSALLSSPRIPCAD